MMTSVIRRGSLLGSIRSSTGRLWATIFAMVKGVWAVYGPQFLGWSKGGQGFFSVPKGKDQNFLLSKRRDQNFFSIFFAPFLGTGPDSFPKPQGETRISRCRQMGGPKLFYRKGGRLFVMAGRQFFHTLGEITSPSHK